MRVDPVRNLRGSLYQVEKPARYVGGEYGSISRQESEDGSFLVGICFPDLYEIGMSNLAVRYLYRLLNEIEGVRAERVFAPAPDFERVLESTGTPLYTLESGIPLNELDVLAISVGYELSATAILTVLEHGGVSLDRRNRLDTDPVVVGGGPAVTNPVPFGGFLDCVYLGEAERGFPELIQSALQIKKRGGSRQDILGAFLGNSSIWHEEEKRKAVRSIWHGFPDYQNTGPLLVPNLKTVQDHGVIEVMRGCPNGCRFCHAGIYYRPYRARSFSSIITEADRLVHEGGYREITLSSLSVGDYQELPALLHVLNDRYRYEHVSFSLPSLRINSFTLPLIEEIGRVRKSGLTFAVETPQPSGQAAINKSVSIDHITQILKKAKDSGWRLAKFYFMIGLPVPEAEREAEYIGEYIQRIRDSVKLNLNINIGTFVPKPHTPFQWASQELEEQALEKIRSIKSMFQGKGVNIKYHSPFLSTIEGVISRGDKRAGEAILEAYRLGARLDAWEEHFRADIWRSVLDVQNKKNSVVNDMLSARNVNEKLPWDSIHIGVSDSFLKKEWQRAQEGEYTDVCSKPCNHRCGACSDEGEIVDPKSVSRAVPETTAAEGEGFEERFLLFSFCKTNASVFLSHLDTSRVFERAFLRTGLPVKFSEGFNPKPKLEFANPLPLGASGMDEIAGVKLIAVPSDIPKTENLLSRLNAALPPGIDLNRLEYESRSGKKSLMARYCGSDYLFHCGRNGGEQKNETREVLDTLFGLYKKEVIADDLSALLDYSYDGGDEGDANAFFVRYRKGRGEGTGLLKWLRLHYQEQTGRVLYEDVLLERLRSYAYAGESCKPFFS
ncbi:MAG: TIGR03936 family radical SAM-associated protein [Spirochaetales bacterium]|nr:TIGR03936 family radical SAM-associated protein [Spirochaetales bacterium]